MRTADRPAPWYSVITVFVVCVTFTVVSNIRASANRTRIETVVCAALAEDANSQRDRLAAFAAEPPATDAGRAQEAAAREALAGYVSRAQQLGCSD